MTAREVTPGRAAYEVWRAAIPDYVCNVPAGPWEDLPETIQAGFSAIAAQERPAPACPDCAHVSMTPAVARPPFGSVLVLAVGTDAPDASVRAAANALAATEEGVTVVIVQSVEALRVWEPAEATRAPALAATMADRDQVRVALGNMLAQRNQLEREAREARADRDDYAARLKAADRSWTKVAVERDAFQADRAHLRAALATLTDRTEGSSVLTCDERNEYRKLIEAMKPGVPSGLARELVTAAENADLRQQCDKLRNLLDEVTHMMTRLGGPGEAKRGHAIRFEAGLPAIDQFSNPEGK